MYTLNNDMPVMKGIKDIAFTFGISEHYARHLALSGKVKAVRVGKGKILINQQSVADFFNQSFLTEHDEDGHIKELIPIPIKIS